MNCCQLSAIKVHWQCCGGGEEFGNNSLLSALRGWEVTRRMCLLTTIPTQGPVTFNLDPPKIGSPRNEFFWNIWTHSEKFVPTVDQPHQGKSVHVNGHEVITKDISSVHRGIFCKLSDWSSSVCLDWPYTALTKIFAQCTRNRMQRAVPPGMRLLHCVLLNLRAWIVSRNLNNLPR